MSGINRTIRHAVTCPKQEQTRFHYIKETMNRILVLINYYNNNIK